jgi:hypothetical protein
VVVQNLVRNEIILAGNSSYCGRNVSDDELGRAKCVKERGFRTADQSQDGNRPNAIRMTL